MTEQKHTIGPIKQIMDELRQHNADIGAGVRQEERLASDARYVAMVRHEGVTVETLAMMTSDLLFKTKRLRAERATLLRACENTLVWLSSFSMPPTSTIAEKQKAIDALKAAIIEGTRTA